MAHVIKVDINRSGWRNEYVVRVSRSDGTDSVVTKATHAEAKRAAIQAIEEDAA